MQTVEFEVRWTKSISAIYENRNFMIPEIMKVIYKKINYGGFENLAPYYDDLDDEIVQKLLNIDISGMSFGNGTDYGLYDTFIIDKDDIEIYDMDRTSRTIDLSITVRINVDKLLELADKWNKA